MNSLCVVILVWLNASYQCQIGIGVNIMFSFITKKSPI